MSDREHFIATLQACYVGDRNAFEEIVRIYDEKENIIKEVKSQLDYLETYSSKEDVFADMKRRLYNIERIVGGNNDSK